MRSSFKKVTNHVSPAAALSSGFIVFLLVRGFYRLIGNSKAQVELLRFVATKYGQNQRHRLMKHVPAGVGKLSDISYDDSDKDANLDIYYPQSSNDEPLVPIVWVHGGGWIAGSKDSKEPWYRILASYGYAVISVDYSIAPLKTYPTPVKQVNRALRFLASNAGKLNIDPTQFVLAGDSSGAQIVSQVALVNTNPEYADIMSMNSVLSPNQIVATILACGAYDPSQIDTGTTLGGKEIKRLLVSTYLGSSKLNNNDLIKYAAVHNFVTNRFPATFITVGNYDPLASHSYVLAKALKRSDVDVDEVFYAKSHRPKLHHEYQFNLDSKDGQSTLKRMLSFLSKHTNQG